MKVKTDYRNIARSLPASSRNTLVFGSSTECHTVARCSVTAEIAACFSLNILLGSISFPRNSGSSQVLSDRVLISIVTSSWPILTLETI